MNARPAVVIGAVFAVAVAGPVASAHEPEARIAELDRRLASRPDDAAALVERARLRRLSGELSAAFLDAEQGVGLAAAGVEARAERGLCLEALGHGARALADLDAGLAARPRDPFLRLARARVHEAAGRLDAAAVDLEASLASRADPDVFIRIASVVYRVYGVEAALKALSDAHRRTGAPLMLVERLRLEREARLWPRALATATQLSEGAPDDPEATLDRARALDDAGRAPESRQVLARAAAQARARLERRPTALARLVWAKVLRAQGRRGEALVEAREAARMAEGWPESAALVRTLEGEGAR